MLALEEAFLNHFPFAVLAFSFFWIFLLFGLTWFNNATFFVLVLGPILDWCFRLSLLPFNFGFLLYWFQWDTILVDSLTFCI